MHVAKILDWNLQDQIQYQALKSWEKSLNLTMLFLRKVLIAYFVSCLQKIC